MIIKARPHGNGGNLARYLLSAKEGETVHLLDLREAASDNLRKALTDWEASARSLTKGEKVLYHAHVRLRDGERLDEAQWLKVFGEIETRLGLTDCPRAVVGHNNAEKGLHVHAVWSRLDAEKEKLVSLSNDRKHHHAIARELEIEFGLKPVEPGRKDTGKKRLSDRETRALKDRGADRKKLEGILRAAWNACESGQELKAMLKGFGVELAPGDRRDWVIDYEGLKVNPVRMLEGVTAGDFRSRVSDLDLAEARRESRQSSPAMPLFGKKAKALTRHQWDGTLANDESKTPPKTGFRKLRHEPELGGN